MTFLGKWTFGASAQTVRIDVQTGLLSVGAPPADRSDRFNAYGTPAAFVLQGANGLYVGRSGAGYAATKGAGDAPNQFTLDVLQPASDAEPRSVRVVDLGSGGTAPQFYWNADGAALAALAKGDAPPTTTVFPSPVVTVGLDEILSQGFGTVAPDLTWVTLAGTDFTQATVGLDFTKSTLTHTNLSHTTFEAGTGFDGSTAQHVDFSGAMLDDCSIGTIDFSNSNFTRARMRRVTADNAIFDHTTMTGADLGGVLNLANARFLKANLQSVNFAGAGNIDQTDFTGADLTGAVFTGASVTGTMTVKGANLTAAALNNPDNVITIYPKMIVLDGQTNFTAAKLQYLDLSGYSLRNMMFTQADMTGCNLQGADLTWTDLSFATLDGANLTGTVRMNGANLSNASLKGADLTSAQLGALSLLFGVAEPGQAYDTFLNALRTGSVADVTKVFGANHIALTGTVTVRPSLFSASTWTVEAATSASSTPVTYTVVQEAVGGTTALDVYAPTVPAALSNAFMVNVTLTSANMIGVNASGASIYGVASHKPNLNRALLQGAQFANANLGNADFSSANLAGVSFDFATLTNAVFQNAQLTPSAAGTPASFIGANLQSATFDGATLTNVIFTNAALGIANPKNPSSPAGVWLFSLSQEQAATVVGELDGASNPSPPAAPQHQFTLPLQALQQLKVPGTVGKGIVKGFADAGIALTADAVLTIMSEAVYWQLTDGATRYVIFPSYDTVNFMPALGVAAGSEYQPAAQFTLPLSLQGHLKNGPADAAVIAAFKAAGHPVGAAAQITIAQHPTDWQVVNGAPGYEVYAIWLDLSAGSTALTVRPPLTDVIQAFNNVSIALGIRATVTRIASGGWSVSNDAENPFNPVKDYIIFNVLPSAATGGLDVFGAFMRIQRLKSATESEYYNIPAGITALTQSQMQAKGNICPNGEFATTNQANGLSYDRWLRARTTSRPPFCVPDPQGMYVCPR